jgi:hypothetical protein
VGSAWIRRRRADRSAGSRRLISLHKACQSGCLQQVTVFMKYVFIWLVAEDRKSEPWRVWPFGNPNAMHLLGGVPAGEGANLLIFLPSLRCNITKV